MHLFLTSSPFLPDRCALNPAEGFIDALRQAVAPECEALFVCSDPDAPEFTDRIAGDMAHALDLAGFRFSAFRVLDGRNQAEAAELVDKAGFVILAGGHVPTQNAFLSRAGLRSCLRDFDGTVMGISAGSMNCARVVYVQPELPEEVADPFFQLFRIGLDLTKTKILPHYQRTKDCVLNGLRLFEDLTFEHSRGGRCFWALPDGSYILGENGRETIFGEAWRIADGRIDRVCGPGESKKIDEAMPQWYNT